MTLNLKRLREMESIVLSWEDEINEWNDDDHSEQISNVSAYDIVKLVDAVREQDAWIERVKHFLETLRELNNEELIDLGSPDCTQLIELLDEVGE